MKTRLFSWPSLCEHGASALNAAAPHRRRGVGEPWASAFLGRVASHQAIHPQHLLASIAQTQVASRFAFAVEHASVTHQPTLASVREPLGVRPVALIAYLTRHRFGAALGSWTSQRGCGTGRAAGSRHVWLSGTNSQTSGGVPSWTAMVCSGGGSDARRGSEIGGHNGEDAHETAMAPTAAMNVSEHLPSISGPMVHPADSPGQPSHEGGRSAFQNGDWFKPHPSPH